MSSKFNEIFRKKKQDENTEGNTSKPEDQEIIKKKMGEKLGDIFKKKKQ